VSIPLISPSATTDHDRDGDGNEDLVVTNGDGATVSVFLGDGFAGFARVKDVAVGAGPRRSPG
jgi:hypothetical protein